MHALGAARFNSTSYARLVQRLTDQMGSLHNHTERRSLRRIKIKYEIVGMDRITHAEERDVVLQGALIGKPEQGPAVITQGVLDFAPRGIGPDGHPLHPLRRVFGKVLLHERRLPGSDADDRQWPIT